MRNEHNFDRVLGILESHWHRWQFRPQRWAVFVNPYYISRRGLYRAILRHAQGLSGKLLDFGAGSSPYRELFNVEEYVTVDIAASSFPNAKKRSQYYYDGHTLPFDNDEFDAIFSSEVFDDIFNLPEILGELRRVLKSDGKILVTLPFAWNEHEAPYDFARYTSYGIRYLFEQHGFEIITQEKTTGFIETVFQLLSTYLVERKVFRRYKYLRPLVILLIAAPINILGIVFSIIFPKDDTFFHNNIVIARKAN